jgi:hypothetical protein
VRAGYLVSPTDSLPDIMASPQVGHASEARRVRLQATIDINTPLNSVPILKYYALAERLKGQGEQELVKPASELRGRTLDIVYVFLKRYAHFATMVIPSHNYYKSPTYASEKTALVKSLPWCVNSLELIVRKMDQEEEQKQKDEESQRAQRARDEAAKRKLDADRQADDAKRRAAAAATAAPLSSASPATARRSPPATAYATPAPSAPPTPSSLEFDLGYGATEKGSSATGLGSGLGLGSGSGLYDFAQLNKLGGLSISDSSSSGPSGTTAYGAAAASRGHVPPPPPPLASANASASATASGRHKEPPMAYDEAMMASSGSGPFAPPPAPAYPAPSRGDGDGAYGSYSAPSYPPSYPPPPFLPPPPPSPAGMGGLGLGGAYPSFDAVQYGGASTGHHSPGGAPTSYGSCARLMGQALREWEAALQSGRARIGYLSTFQVSGRLKAAWRCVTCRGIS